MIIDMHCHYVPDAVSELLRQRTVAPFIERLPDGTEVRHMPAGNKLVYSADYTDMAGRILHMDGLGIDHQMLSMGLLFGLHALPVDEALVIARAFNDDLSELSKTHPDRFSGLALLPMDDIGVATDEYRRARRDLGLLGAILPVNSFVTRAEADKLRPIFEAAQELGGHIFLHPGARPDQFQKGAEKKSEEAQRDNMMERMALNVQANLAQAMVTVSFSDFLDPYPDVTVQVANLGGTLPMVIERMDHTVMTRSSGDELVSNKLGRVYLDCASLGPNAVEIAAAVYGPDKLVFGTDNPIFPVEQALKAVEASNIDGDSKSKLLGDNARKLMGR
jgi:predicted TIM-barrel fold metal-dependent hydrolase